ncbi:unnamed protein product, partial [marine sediment metagenome]
MFNFSTIITDGQVPKDQLQLTGQYMYFGDR